ncbi:hypothetical protein CEXT_692611 [Caerostris extrusa]|uniref:Uncharacterized protein n=1 Tax=Caerostris extrusa TaxID=172846 RepID=A0AAV4SHJ3_CAEEX|nr:hypothetical protein CEXT_692611 [Caerostris extrusa]
MKNILAVASDYDYPLISLLRPTCNSFDPYASFETPNSFISITWWIFTLFTPDLLNVFLYFLPPFAFSWLVFLMAGYGQGGIGEKVFAIRITWGIFWKTQLRGKRVPNRMLFLLEMLFFMFVCKKNASDIVSVCSESETNKLDFSFAQLPLHYGKLRENISKFS